MKSYFIGGLLLCSILFLNTVTESEDLSEPIIPDNSIFRTSVELKYYSFSAGTAFALSVAEDKNPLIITALHIFGRVGGLSTSIPPEKLKDEVRKVKIKDAFNGNDCGSASKVLTLNGAKSLSSYDVAAFEVDLDSKVVPYELSKTIPAVGDTVWLAASVYGGATATTKKHKAIVVSSDNSFLDSSMKIIL